MFNMITAQTVFYDTAVRIEKLISKLIESSSNDDAEQKIKKIKTLDYTLRRSLEECEYIRLNMIDRRYINRFEDTREKLIELLSKNFPLTAEEKQLYLAKNAFFSINAMDVIEKVFGHATLNTRVQFFYQKYHHQRPIDVQSVDDLTAFSVEINKILDIANNQKRTANVLFSNAEYFIRAIKNKRDNIRQYAIYDGGTNPLMGTETRKMFDKVAIGNPSGAYIKNNSVDIIFHRFTHNIDYFSTYYSEKDYKIGKTKTEQDIIRLSHYIKNNGVLFLAIPKHLLTMQLCIDISKKFDFLYAIRNDKNNLSENTAVTYDYILLALRCNTNKTAKEINDTFAEITNIDIEEKTIPENSIKDMFKPLSGKKSSAPINLFRGQDMDIAAIQLLLENNNYKDILSDNKKKKTIHPLLPLKSGQIGQILASGMLDGVIEEGNGFKHVVRGHIYKGNRSTIDYQQDPDTGKTNEIEKIYENNMVEINLFAGDGEFKTVMLTK